MSQTFIQINDEFDISIERTKALLNIEGARKAALNS